MPRFDLDGVSADGLSLHSLRASVAGVWAHVQLLLRRSGVFRGGTRLPKALFAGCLAAAMLAVLLLSGSCSRMTRCRCFSKASKLTNLLCPLRPRGGNAAVLLLSGSGSRMTRCRCFSKASK